MRKLLHFVVFDVLFHGEDAKCYANCVNLMLVIESDDKTDGCVMDTVYETIGSDGDITVLLRVMMYDKFQHRLYLKLF